MATQETTTAAGIAATIDHRESKVLLWELSRSANVFHDVFDATKLGFSNGHVFAGPAYF